jgi:AcrR family transcriptional regulator
MAGGFDLFHILDIDKQQRIIRAALAEFGEKGFKHASTSAIAQAANIGKGMLFYYFGSKEALFNFICEYCFTFMKNEYLLPFNERSNDFLERYMQLVHVKRQALSRWPEIAVFFDSLLREENTPTFQKFALEAAQIRQAINERLYTDVDNSLFRGDLNGGDAIRYMKWLFDGYEAEMKERLKDSTPDVSDPDAFTEEWSRFNTFIYDLRKIFYRGEFTNGDH